MPNESHSHYSVTLSTEDDGEGAINDSSRTKESHRDQTVGTKRKRRTSSKLLKKVERQKVTRACDICKTRKLRCSGTLPCNRCSNRALHCEYNFEHRRGRPALPEPGLIISKVSHRNAENYSTPNSQHREHQQTFERPISNEKGVHHSSHEQEKSSGSLQEADETRFDGDYIGPTSGIAFLHRAKKRFQQDFVGSISSFDGQGSQNASVFAFGDGWNPDFPASSFVFPSRYEAKNLLDRYFDFAMPTYRFLQRAAVDSWMEIMHNESESQNCQAQQLSSAKTAIVLLTFATAKLYFEDAAGLRHDAEAKDFDESAIFSAEAERKLSKETGPVSLESVQARLAQCIYLLASSRINQAWYTFGTASQMILALGLHRKRFSQTLPAACTSIGIECRKRVFWSAYTLDRYLSVILGRPRIFRDEDVDQHLPDRINDGDLAMGCVKSKSAYNQCVIDGLVFHAKLAKIIGEISSNLYPINASTETDWIKSAERWTTELKNWKKSLPAFLEPSKVDPSILVPIFQRQSTVLRLAYAHALILANRPSLLKNFGDLSRRQGLPRKGLEGSIKECVDAAVVILDIVNGFIEEGKMYNAFWFTHYISFCAIATLYVYTIRQSITQYHVEIENGNGFKSNTESTTMENYSINTKYFEAAEKCQRSIAETTAKISPFGRYSIILDELKNEVLQRLGKVSGRLATAIDGQPVLEAHNLMEASRDAEETPSRAPNTSEMQLLDVDALQEDSFYPQTTESLQSQGSALLNAPFDFRSALTTPRQQFDESMLDLDLFGPQGELMGWWEFDSCAINWPDGFGTFDP